jgi:hypothetical protein
MCIDVDSLQCVCAEVSYKFNCIFIFSSISMSTIIEHLDPSRPSGAMHTDSVLEVSAWLDCSINV